MNKTIKHSIFVRVFHWVNVFFILGLSITGIMIGEKFHQTEVLKFHISTGIGFLCNLLFFLVYTMTSGHYKEIVPSRTDFKNLVPTILNDLGLKKGKVKNEKYNSAQKFAYTGVISILTVSLLTGLLLLLRVQLDPSNSRTSLFHNVKEFHESMMFLVFLFLALHITQVIRAGINNFKEMITGR